MTTETKTEVAPVPQAPVNTKMAITKERLPFIPRDFDDAWRQAEVLSKASVVPKGFIGKPHDILVTLLTGAELGISPMQALRDIPVVNGKGFIQSQLKVALVKQHPDCVYFRMVESTHERAVYETERKGEGKTRFEYTMADAKTAELTGKDNWRKDPRSMLRARCSGQLCDIVWSDVTRGIGDTDDLPETKTVNAAPQTFAPPLSTPMEDAQVVAPTPPPAPGKDAKKAFDGAVGAGDQVREPKLRVDNSSLVEPPRMREPGDDDDAPPPPAPKSSPPKGQSELPVGPGEDLAVFAEVKALVSKDGFTEAELDVISPRARRVQGPMRKEISDLIVGARQKLAAKKAGK